ncbi:MAG: cupin domain-containing protein [Solirubrobacterales bacterium]|nr:cupin domain-containing protein [Solirubrobacterales bacterium]
MGLRRFRAGDGRRVKAMVPNGPSAEVLIGTGDDWPMGVAHVVVPPGGGMPRHNHGSSAAMVVPLDGPVVISDADDDAELEVGPGGVVTIPVGALVEVHNRGEAAVAIMVVFDPPDFTRQLESWPVDEDRAGHR